MSRFITKKHSRILDLSQEIKDISAKDSNSLVFLAKPFIQTTLPHSDPGDIPEWYRVNGRLRMSLRPGWGNDELTGERLPIGIPYGALPRLLLIFMSSHAIRTGTRHIDLGNSLSSFLNKLGLNSDGRGINSPAMRLKNQLLRLIRSTISIESTESENGKQILNFMDMSLVKEGRIEWYSNNAGIPQSQENIFEGNWIYLTETFFECLTSSAVPLDERIILELKQSPLALDLYAWMTHRTFGFSESSNKKISFISWTQLHNQFGSNYKDIRDFKKNAKPTIRNIKALSKNIFIEEMHGGLGIGKKLTLIK